MLENPSYKIPTAKTMHRHKKKCAQRMRCSSTYDRSYQLKRALLTLSGEDADTIPKVLRAGEIFHEGENSYQLMHNGIKIFAHSYYDAKWVSDVIFGLKGHHEPQEEKCFYEVLKHLPENATMIELGSYWAYYSLWFASAVKNPTNYLIEPDPLRLEIGRKHFRFNNKSGLFRRGFVGVVKDEQPDTIDAECISIEDFIDKEKIERVHILHADIQGAEYPMLQSAQAVLDQIDYFFLSTHDPVSDHLPCLHFLKNNDFCILAEHTALESCSGDGLIVARRKLVEGPDWIPIKKYASA